MNSISILNKKFLYISGIVISSGLFLTYKYYKNNGKKKSNISIEVNTNLEDIENNIKQKYNKEIDDILNDIESRSLIISKAEKDYNIALERFNSLKEKSNFDTLQKHSVEDVFNKNKVNFDLFLDISNKRLLELNRLLNIQNEKIIL